MDPFTMAKLLLGDVQLTPGQAAQLRALNTKYFTELYALSRTDRPPAGQEAELVALDAMIARDIREMLTEEQRDVLDRNLPRLERAVEREVSDERLRQAAQRGASPSAAPEPGGPHPPEAPPGS